MKMKNNFFALLFLFTASCTLTDYERINWDVNEYPYESDLEVFGHEHYAQAISIAGKGDCEDYALEKALYLEHYKPQIVVLLCPDGGHAILKIDVNGKEKFLDNKSDHILTKEQAFADCFYLQTQEINEFIAKEGREPKEDGDIKEFRLSARLSSVKPIRTTIRYRGKFRRVIRHAICATGQ